MTQIDEVAFPRLTSAEVALVKPLATARDYADGETIFRAGQADIDLYIVECGQIEIRNPTDGQRVIVVHERPETSRASIRMSICFRSPGGFARTLRIVGREGSGQPNSRSEG